MLLALDIKLLLFMVILLFRWLNNIGGVNRDIILSGLLFAPVIDDTIPYIGRPLNSLAVFAALKWIFIMLSFIKYTSIGTNFHVTLPFIAISAMPLNPSSFLKNIDELLNGGTFPVTLLSL